jgi:hypothetical protein
VADNKIGEIMAQDRYPAHRSPFAPNPGYRTQLPLLDEFAFRQWVKDRGVPFDPDHEPQDYDMRGFYRAQAQGNPLATNAVNPNDQQLHYPDYWKTPLHETFSNESQWALAGAPGWSGNQLITPGGRIVYDEENPPQRGPF